MRNIWECVCVGVCVWYQGEEDVLYQLCDTEDSSDEVLEQSYTKVTSKQASQVTQPCIRTCSVNLLKPSVMHSNTENLTLTKPNPTQLKYQEPKSDVWNSKLQSDLRWGHDWNSPSFCTRPLPQGLSRLKQQSSRYAVQRRLKHFFSLRFLYQTWQRQVLNTYH